MRAGKKPAMSYPVSVSAAHYPASTIKVAPAFVEPPKEADPVIAAADGAKKQAFVATDTIPLWSGAFERRRKRKLLAYSAPRAFTTARKKASTWAWISARALARRFMPRTQEL